MPVLHDTFDYRSYEMQTEARVKVQPARVFADELDAEFEAKTEAKRAVMLSTKLRHYIDFQPGDVTCWAGFNGHRKSTYTSQVALDLCVQRQRTLIASFEMRPAKTLARMARQASAMAEPGKNWRKEFLRWSDSRLWIFDHMGRVDPKVCLAVCNYFGTELKGKHVFIDSMMMVVATEDKFDEQKQFITDCCRLAQETGLHVHVIAHCRKPNGGDEGHPPSKYDIKGTSAVSDQASNVITIWENKGKRAALEANPHDGDQLQKPDALVSVVKQRHGAWEGSIKHWFDSASMRFIDNVLEHPQPYVLQEPL